MIWYICFFVSLALLGLAVYIGVQRHYGELRVGAILLVLFLSACIAYLPVFAELHDAAALVFATLINTLRIISLDAFHLDYYANITQNIAGGSGFFCECYLLLLGCLHTILPIMSALAAYTILLRCFASFQTFRINLRKRPLYVLSGWSEQTFLLAKSIRAAEKHSDIIFANCSEKPKNYPNTQALRCVFNGDKISELRLRYRKNKDIYYFCISPDEDKNLNDALHLIKSRGSKEKSLQAHTHIMVRSSMPDCDTMIDATLKGSIDIRIIDDSEEAAYQLLQNYPLFRGAKDGEINLLLVGFGEVNQNVLRTAVWCGQLSGYKLHIRVCGRGIEDAYKHFLVRYPALAPDGRYDIRFFSCADAEQLQQILAENGSGATYVVLDCGGDRENLEQALQLRQQMYLKSEDFMHAPPIYVYTQASDKMEMIRDLRTSDSKDGRRVHYGLIPFGNNESVYSYKALVKSPLEALARNVHLVYSDIFSDGNFDVPAALEQYNLSEVKKRSNRANAMHIRYKLGLLGLDYTEAPDAEDVELSEYLTKEKLAKLSFSEHDRWMAFLETEGWREATIPQVTAYQAAGLAPGRHESAILKMHPFICDYYELPARSEALHQKDSTIYDELLISRIPEILHDRWGVSGRVYHIIKSEQSLGGNT